MSQLPPPIEPEPTPLSYAVADETAIPKFGLHAWAWVCFVIAVIAGFTLSNLKGSGAPSYDPARTVGTSVGVALGVAIFSVLPAWIGFYMFRRSRTAASVICVVMFVLVISGQISELRRQTRQKQALQTVKAMEAQQVQLTQQMRQKIASGEWDSEQAAQMLDQISSTANNAAKNLSGDEATCMRISSMIMLRLKEQMARYHKALEGVELKTPLQPTWAVNRTDFTDCRDRIARFKEENLKTRELYSTLDTLVAAELKKSNVSPAVSRDFLPGFSAKFVANRTTFNMGRDQDDRMAALLLQTADLLETNWGQWEYDAKSNHIIFASDPTLRQYEAIRTQFDDLVSEQKATREILLNAATK